MKKRIIIAITILICTVNAYAQAAAYYQDRIYTRAKIIDIEKKKITNVNADDIYETHIRIEILDGELKGSKKTAVFSGESDMPKAIQYQKGATVFVGISKVGYSENMEEYISIYDVDNTTGIIILVVLLVLAIAFVGRLKGILSLFALIITILLVFFVFIPCTLQGYSPLPIAIGISIISILITLPIISGFRLKTLAAVIGAISGIIVASLIAVIFGWALHLSGIITNEMITVFHAVNVNIDLRYLSLSGMILAALGAIMDVTVSIASSATEVYEANPQIPAQQAFKSVMNIGKDILGSMVNTLILAYVGSSLPLILLISLRLEPGMPFWMIFNYNLVLNEIMKSAVGSMGMFLSIPLTAFIAIELCKRHYKKNHNNVN